MGFFALVSDRSGGRTAGAALTGTGTTTVALAIVSPPVGVVVAGALGGVTTGALGAVTTGASETTVGVFVRLSPPPPAQPPHMSVHPLAPPAWFGSWLPLPAGEADPLLAASDPEYALAWAPRALLVKVSMKSEPSRSNPAENTREGELCVGWTPLLMAS